MNSFLKEKKLAMKELYDEVFRHYPKSELIQAVEKLILDVKKTKDVGFDYIEQALDNVLGKTETFNVMLTLFELEKRAEVDEELKKSMSDPSYNQHRTIAINICDMYSSGATSFFGYVDCMFRSFFPEKHPKSFLAKGICAIIASVAEVIVIGQTKDYAEKNKALLASRGVSLESLVDMVYELQQPYNEQLTKEDCKKHVLGVLKKEQTFHTIQLCTKIDSGVESHVFGDQFQAIVGNDEGLYGVDETVNTSVSKMYGMIAITNFGFLDKVKPGIIGDLDSAPHDKRCNTYLDDSICAIVSAACARLAYNHPATKSKPKKK